MIYLPCSLFRLMLFMAALCSQKFINVKLKVQKLPSPHLKSIFFRFRVYFSKFLLDFKIYERKLLANINTPPSADSRKAVTLFDRGATWREAVAVITGHTDDKGSRQGERTATDSSSTALFIVQREEENARRSYLDKRRSSRAGRH